jgi:hypothetical protein
MNRSPTWTEALVVSPFRFSPSLILVELLTAIARERNSDFQLCMLICLIWCLAVQR